jgi:hypothetical protein
VYFESIWVIFNGVSLQKKVFGEAILMLNRDVNEASQARPVPVARNTRKARGPRNIRKNSEISEKFRKKSELLAMISEI